MKDGGKKRIKEGREGGGGGREGESVFGRTRIRKLPSMKDHTFSLNLELYGWSTVSSSVRS